MRAAAYQYAEGSGPMPKEVACLNYIDRFGVQGVYGRALGFGEIQRLVTVESIISAYRERAASENWAVWAQKNKGKNRLLEQAMKAANDGKSTD